MGRRAEGRLYQQSNPQQGDVEVIQANFNCTRGATQGTFGYAQQDNKLVFFYLNPTTREWVEVFYIDSTGGYG